MKLSVFLKHNLESAKTQPQKKLKKIHIKSIFFGLDSKTQSFFFIKYNKTGPILPKNSFGQYLEVIWPKKN
jgi:hypothetical protein